MLRALERRFPNIWTMIIRLGIVIGVLVGEVLIGRMAVRLKTPVALLAIALLPVGGILLARHGRVEHGVLGIILTAAVVRFTIPTGTVSRIVISLVVTAGVLVLWISEMLLQDKRLYIKPAPTNIPLIGFIVTSIVSYFWSNAFRDQLVVVWDTWSFVQLGGLGVMILLPGAFLVTANRLHEVKWIVWLTVIILVVGGVAIVGSYLRLPVDFLQVRPLFPTWFISLAYALALFDRRLPWWGRLILLVLTGAWIYRVFIRQFGWLSAWMPALSAAAVISALRSKRLLLIFVIVFVVYVALNLGTIEVRLQEESVGSGETRLDAWLHNWRVTGNHILFGVGPAGYAVYYMSYFPAEAMATHSTYIDILSQTGIVGFMFFVWFFAALFVIGWRLRRWTKGRADFPEAFTVAAIGGYVGTILAMGLGDWIVPFVYTQTIAGFDYAVYTWVLLGAALSLYHIFAQSERVEA